MGKKLFQFLPLVIVAVVLAYVIWFVRRDMNDKIAGIENKSREQITKIETVVKQQQIVTQIYHESEEGVKRLELELGGKISAIEKANGEIHTLIADLTAKKDVLEKQLVAADGKITSLDGKIGETQKNCQEITVKLTDLTAKVEQNTKTINEINALIEKLKQQTVANSGQIDDIKLMFQNYDIVLAIEKEKQKPKGQGKISNWLK